MRKLVSTGLYALSAAAAALQLCGSSALAVDTMTDWTGQNSNPANTIFEVVTTNNNYGLISPTSVGGDIQSKINFHSPADPTVLDPNDPNIVLTNKAHVYFSDPTLVDGNGDPLTLDFTKPLHMEGTITFNSSTATEPNLLFGWYNSEDTTHRVGLGISNFSMAQGGAVANSLRIDFGYAATGGNRFHYVSTDGNQGNMSPGSVVPNGTYPFTFDYVPGNANVPGGGSMSATVGTFFKTVQPLETEPEDLDFFAFDRFGFVQRSTSTTSATVQNPFNTYNVVFSNVDYTGGAEAEVALLGDFDSDDDVDGADYGIWQTNYGTGTTLATGDADGDGDADGNDFLVWQQNVTVPPVAAIPEPATIATLTVAASGLGLRGRRTRR
jgi:hypothetical protein